MIELYLILIILFFVIIECFFYFLIRSVNKKFPWLIMQKDESPHLDPDGLKKFIAHGYDSELGWIRKSNTSHDELGKSGKITWNIDSKGSRTNPGFENLPSKISCYGDSFTFSRQVNDNETWEHFLSKLQNTNVLNFGVGNYGLDQALLRLKREFPKNKTDLVIMGVVPETISRIHSMWRHYFEYGNTFGFKPRFILKDNQLFLIKNIIDEPEKFNNYKSFLNHVRQHDYFYKKKFKKEKLFFPYSITIFKNTSRNFSLIKSVLSSKTNSWNSMKIIMNINLQWRVNLFSERNCISLLQKTIENYSKYVSENNSKPIFVFLPQKDDLLFIKNNFHYYSDFVQTISKINNLVVLDITNDLLNEKNLDDLYSDNNDYGGHFSKLGNEKIAMIIHQKLIDHGLL